MLRFQQTILENVSKACKSMLTGINYALQFTSDFTFHIRKLCCYVSTIIFKSSYVIFDNK